MCIVLHCDAAEGRAPAQEQGPLAPATGHEKGGRAARGLLQHEHLHLQGHRYVLYSSSGNSSSDSTGVVMVLVTVVIVLIVVVSIIVTIRIPLHCTTVHSGSTVVSVGICIALYSSSGIVVVLTSNSMCSYSLF